MEKSLAWSKATKGIWYSVLGYGIFSFIGGLIAALSSAASTLSKASKFVDSGDVSALNDGIDIVPILVSIVNIFFLWLIIRNLAKWRDLVDAADAVYVSRIRSAFIVSIVAVVVAMLPIPLAAGIIGGIISIVAFFMQMSAYSSLKSSRTLPAAAASGMGMLFTYTILALIAVLLGFIPFLGIVGLILSVVSFVFMLIGWAKVGYSRI